MRSDLLRGERRGGLIGVLNPSLVGNGLASGLAGPFFQINPYAVLPKEPLWIDMIGTFAIVPLRTQYG